MPSNYTQNYKLSQWEKTDKVLMEDFNADNLAIDNAIAAEKAARESAIKAEADARTAADQSLTAALEKKADKTALTSLQGTVSGLSNRAGAQLISRTVTSSAGTNIIVDFSGVDWSQWSVVFCALVLGDGSSSYNVRISSYSVNSSVTNSSVVVFFPLSNPDANVMGLTVTGNELVTGFSHPQTFSGLTAYNYSCNHSTTFPAGTSMTVWGLK